MSQHSQWQIIQQPKKKIISYCYQEQKRKRKRKKKEAEKKIEKYIIVLHTVPVEMITSQIFFFFLKKAEAIRDYHREKVVTGIE